MSSRKRAPRLPGHRLLRRTTSRMDAFSDGVFAIAITILVLEISVPEGSSDDLLQAILDQWPSYLAYVVSFATIGAVWLKHTVVTDLIKNADQTLLRLNLGLLLLVSFLPFPTRLVAENITEGSEPERIAVVFYGIILLLMSSVIGLMWRYSVRAGLVDDEIDPEDIHAATKLLAPALGFYVVALAVGFFAPQLAVGIMLLAAVLFWIPASVLPVRRRDRHEGEAGEPPA